MADDDVQIVGVQFGELPQWVEVTYVEASKVTQRIQHIHTLRVDPTLCPSNLEEVIGELREIVSAGLIQERNPPETFTASRQV